MGKKRITKHSTDSAPEAALSEHDTASGSALTDNAGGGKKLGYRLVETKNGAKSQPRCEIIWECFQPLSLPNFGPRIIGAPGAIKWESGFDGISRSLWSMHMWSQAKGHW